MKKVICIALVFVLGIAVYLACPRSVEPLPEPISEPPIEEPVPPEPEPQLEPEPEPELPDDVCIKAGGDSVPTTGFLRRSNGQTITIDLTGKNVISARVRFRGVNGTATSYTYKTVTDNANYLKSGGSETQDRLSPLPVPAGYAFDRITATTSISSSIAGDYFIQTSIGITYSAMKSGNGTSASVSKYTSVSDDLETYADFFAKHAKDYTATFTLTTRGKKAVTTTTYTTNPKCGGVSHTGTLTGGTVSSWEAITLTSNKANTLVCYVSGSGVVDVEIEYTLKSDQPAPASPTVSNLTDTSVQLNSTTVGCRIVCNGQTKARGSIWSGLTPSTKYTAYSYMPATSTYNQSPNSPTLTFTTNGAPTATTSPATNISYTTATISGSAIANGATPTRYLRWGLSSDAMTNIVDCGSGTGAYTANLSGLQADTKYYYQAYAINTYGTGQGTVLSFTTLYPTLPAPEKVEPAPAIKTEERSPQLVFTLTAHPDNPATKYLPRASISPNTDMSSPVFTSAAPSPIWEYWDGTDWQPFPVDGVAPNTTVRVTPPELPYGIYYWDCYTNDGTRSGYHAPATSFRVVLSVKGLYLLNIKGNDWPAFSVRVHETCNGSLGEISFSVDNQDGTANQEIQYGDTVLLGVNDSQGRTEEFKGIVRSKTPRPEELAVTCILGDGILGERLVKQNYSSQDIGLTVKHIIETYCYPLTTTNVDTNTGFTLPVVAKDKTPLRVLEDLRRNYGVFYFIDKGWDVHFYKESAITASSETIRYGEGTGLLFLDDPRVITQKPLASHVTVRVKGTDTEYTAVVSPAPSDDKKLERLIEIPEGTSAQCQAVATQLLAKWGREQRSISGRIDLTVTLSFLEKIRVVHEQAGINEDMILQRKEHDVLEDVTTTVTLGDIILSEDELVARVLDDVQTPDIVQTNVTIGGSEDGYYIRYSDGTQICWHEVNITYTSDISLNKSWTFPNPFLSGTTPDVQLTLISPLLRGSVATGGMHAFHSLFIRSVSNVSVLPQAQASSGYSWTAGDNLYVKCLAIGRYK